MKERLALLPDERKFWWLWIEDWGRDYILDWSIESAPERVLGLWPSCELGKGCSIRDLAPMRIECNPGTTLYELEL